jgi:membrane fusion protein (multidrug efflux system)
MAMHFSRSLRRLEADTTRRTLLAALAIFSLLVLWFAWFIAARITVYATSHSARLEVDRENRPVEAPVAGRVVRTSLAAGQVVRAGDVLIELDDQPERLAQNQLQGRVEPATRQIAALKAEIDAQQRAMHEDRGAAAAAAAENTARAREATAAADLAAEEARRLRELHARGIASELDAIRAETLAEQRRNEADTATFAASRVQRDFQARQEDRLAKIARLNNEIAAIEAARGDAIAGAERLSYDISQRVVRAPISGTIAEVSTLKAGGLVQPGDLLCTIVPEGTLKVVALFEPAESLGRIREGQPARVRLEGFPWTQYGAANANVRQVAGEVRDGRIRVELSLNDAQTAQVPIQHGLPAEVDVEVEQLSPLGMVLRSAGEKLRVNAAAAPLAPGAR